MTTKKIKYLKFDSLRRFGVEIEVGSEVKKNDVKAAIASSFKQDVYVSRYALSNNNRYWHIKDDSSCGIKGRNGPKGVEIASFVGRGIEDIDQIADVGSVLEKIGCKVNNNCGFHVHVEVKDLNLTQIATIVAYWIKIEKVISLALPIRRNNNEHCKFICGPFISNNFKLNVNQSYSAEELWKLMSPKNLSYYDNDDRRYNLNLVNLVRAIKDNSDNRKTLELRWPEGTLNPVDFRCWIKLFIMFIETCKDREMPESLLAFELDEALACFGISHDENCFFIMSSAMHELKTWFLERIIQHNQDGVVFYRSEEMMRFSQRAKKILNLMWHPLRTYD